MVKKKKSVKKKGEKFVLGARIISVYSFALGVLLVLFGLLTPFVRLLMNGLEMFFRVAFLLVLGLLLILAARDLFKCKNWARIFLVVFNLVLLMWFVFWVIEDVSIFLTIYGVFTFLIPVLIVGYLIFSKEVGKAF